jgi:hypothetical protein
MSLEAFLETLGPEIDDPEEGIDKRTLLKSWLNNTFRVFPLVFPVNSISESWLR